MNADARFWSKVAKSDGCWEWTAARFRCGYGMFSVRRRAVYAHRHVYELENGPIPAGSHVLHKCDNRLCVRPDHLFLGTNADNVADRDKKGRQAKGEAFPFAKLTAGQVREIRANPLSRIEIAALYGVDPSLIGQIRTGKIWRWVT